MGEAVPVPPKPQPRPRSDLRVVVTGFTCLLILLCFARDIDMSFLGFVALPALLLTVLAMGVNSCLRAIYHAVRAAFAPTDYWRTIRLEVMHLGFVGTLLLFYCSSAFQRVPDYVFVWRRLGALEAAVQQCMHGAPEAGGGVRYGQQVAFHYSGFYSSYCVIHDLRGAAALTNAVEPDSYWASFPEARDRARHLWGPWWMR